VLDLIFVNSIVRMYRNDVVLWEFETARRQLSFKMKEMNPIMLLKRKMQVGNGKLIG
jgi:hypothetical protein